MMARHPNQQQLSSWLNGEHTELDEHIDSCLKCANSLDELDTTSTGNVSAISADLRPALLTLLQPPPDLHERISERIAIRLQDRSDADLFGSLLSIPIEAGRIFLSLDDDADDQAGQNPPSN